MFIVDIGLNLFLSMIDEILDLFWVSLFLFFPLIFSIFYSFISSFIFSFCYNSLFSIFFLIFLRIMKLYSCSYRIPPYLSNFLFLPPKYEPLQLFLLSLINSSCFIILIILLIDVVWITFIFNFEWKLYVQNAMELIIYLILFLLFHFY